MQAFNESFGRLLEAWNRHHSLRTHGASIGELAEARATLDALRVEVARRRSGLWSL